MASIQHPTLRYKNEGNQYIISLDFHPIVSSNKQHLSPSGRHNYFSQHDKPSADAPYSLEGVQVFSKRFSHFRDSTSELNVNNNSGNEYVSSSSQQNDINTQTQKSNKKYLSRKQVKKTVLRISSVKQQRRRKSIDVNSNHKLKVTSSLSSTGTTLAVTERSKYSTNSNENNSIPRHASNDSLCSTSSVNNKPTKIYLSQKQSSDLQSHSVGSSQSGSLFPGAPPGSPTPDTLKKYSYVPSLHDNLAKQQVKTKLKAMKKVEQEKERIRYQEQQKLNAKDAKEREQELKRQQRRIIYALNAAMTLAENDQFERFKSDNGLRPKEYPSMFSRH